MNLLKVICAACLVAIINFAAAANNIYVAQNSNGSGDGSTAGNSKSIIWLNNAQLNPGDTVHLVGVITNEIGINGSGTPGNVITVYFENGARLSPAAGTSVACGNRSYVVFDGGVNGIIENTDNGIGLGHSEAVSGIYASGCDHLEVKNLTFQNFYIHPNNVQQGFLDFSGNGAVYMNGFGDGISIHNNSFSNICWVINMGSGTGNGVNIYSNNFVNYDHGATSFGNSASNVKIYNNHFGSTANWDTGVANYYHHDGIHIYYGGGSTLNGVQIYNNLFDGDWGSNNTAHIFCEGDFTHANPYSMSNFMIYNNVFIQWTNNILNNGFFAGSGPNWSLYNNTFVGSLVYNSSGVTVGGDNLMVKNNIFSGLNTFISVGGTNVCPFSNNVYSKPGPGGNSPWWRGTAINSLNNWRAAIGGDANSILTTSAVVDGNGELLPNSSVIGTGADLSAFFQTDLTGAVRSGAWSPGAYQTSGSGLLSLPPTKVSPPTPQNLHLVQPGKS